MANPAINFTLSGLNQEFTLGVSGELAAAAAPALDVSAIAVYNIKLSDMLSTFKFQSDAFDVNDLAASDIKYYVDTSHWLSANLKLNPAHASLTAVATYNTTPSAILTTDADVVDTKNLVKHDFVRYLALKLFNTPYGVDLFSNEEALLSDIVSKGDTAATNIKTALDNVNLTNALFGSPGSKYSTDASANTSNFTRELMRQIAHHAPQRFYGISNDASIKSVPLHENDTINFKVTIYPASGQHNLTSRTNPFEYRTYQIKLILKDTASPTNVVPVEDGSSTQYPYHA
jgi:hypothetical protein